MSISEILDSRYSCRGFLEKEVPEKTLKDVFAKAQRSPSNCNIQPWQVIVVSGETKNTLANNLVNELMTKRGPNPDFNAGVGYQGVHRDRQYGAAASLYGAMGVERHDKEGRQKAMVRNWQFFGAPHAAIFTMDKYLDTMGAVDVGIYAETLNLLLFEQGIYSCFQGALGQYPDPIKKMFDLPEERGVLFGMSFGYPDPDVPANNSRTVRENLSTNVLFAS